MCQSEKRGGERLQRAKAIRDFELRLLEEKGRWVNHKRGPDTKNYADAHFSVGFWLTPADSRSGVFFQELYNLDIWYAGAGKVLNLAWERTGDQPHIVSFRRGCWEDVFLHTTKVN